MASATCSGCLATFEKHSRGALCPKCQAAKVRARKARLQELLKQSTAITYTGIKRLVRH